MNINGKVYIFVLFVFCFSVEGIFLPSALKSKLRNNNETDLYNKVWMKYIEKRLETINMHLQKQKHFTSFLDINKRNFGKTLFKKIPANCKELGFKNADGIQTGIYGKICGSPNGAKERELENVDLCDKLDMPILRAVCYRVTKDRGKY